ncbi:hypothetical protein AUC68_02830 [Methyloceanibacter methanicus]|uniref:Uncharacterized protein n=1 Tax=Methyloceanibacter methanicus TaxID=1774968 RepID=A0A1E3W2Q2_9HYPH|nr:hypothetical protein AUC68_02830 [Methyloceanibacter methanicus]
MQRIDHDVVGIDIGVDLFVGPVGKRVDLDEPALLVPLGHGRVRAGLRLFAAKPGDPALRALQGPVQRPDLPDFAAALPVVDGLAEPVHAIAVHEFLDLARIGHHEADSRPVAQLGQFDRFQDFRKQPARIERKDVHLRAGLRHTGLGDGLQDHLIFQTEARRKGDAAVDALGDQLDALDEIVGRSELTVQFLRGLGGRVPTQRQRVPRGGLVTAADMGKRYGPAFGGVGIGDFGGIETGSQQELRLVGNERPDGANLAGKAKPVAEDPRQAEAAPIGETWEHDGDGTGIAAGGRRQCVVVRGRLQDGRGHIGLGDQRASRQINEHHREPP